MYAVLQNQALSITHCSILCEKQCIKYSLGKMLGIWLYLELKTLFNNLIIKTKENL